MCCIDSNLMDYSFQRELRDNEGEMQHQPKWSLCEAAQREKDGCVYFPPFFKL